METVEFNCPACGARVRAPRDQVGEEGRCPVCGRVFTVPAESEAVDELQLVRPVGAPKGGERPDSARPEAPSLEAAPGRAAPGPVGEQAGRDDAYAIASLVCGLVGLMTSFGTCLIGLPAGICAIVFAGVHKRRHGHNGMSKAGAVLGWLTVILTVVLMLLFMVFFVVAEAAG